MPQDVPGGPCAGEEAVVLATRKRSGVTTVQVTWSVEGQINLTSYTFEYESPRAALNAGWELGEKFERDALFMERMARTSVREWLSRPACS
jgi:hypothetical protein